MSIKDRLKALRLDLGLSREKMGYDIGLSYSMVAQMETGIRDIQVRTIEAICRVYGVNREWLENGTGEMYRPVEPSMEMLAQKYNLNDLDVKLLMAYLKMPERDRAVITGLAREMTAGREPADYEPTIRRMLYLLPVSAGNGNPALEETGEEIDIKKTPAAERADYVLRISGDSMEPEYHDGQLILVQRTPAVDVGELGIFYMDGRVYFKRLGVRELISLNPEVPNVPLAGAEVITEGRVLGPAEQI